MSKDYYKTLGVEKGASKDDIKKAYKRLAKKYHPDLNKEPDAEKRFKEINEAASVLADDQKRQQYDQFGTADFAGYQGGAGGFDFSEFMNQSGDFGFDFESIFDSFFGGNAFGGGGRGRGSRRGSRRGSDLIYEIEITLEEAAFGAEKHITIPKMDHCDECNGTGSAGSGTTTCDECNGTGMVRQTRRTPFGIFATASPCRKCRGEGTIIKNPCRECRGTGIVEKTKRIKVDIPAGVSDGLRLRMPGEGEAGEKAGPLGDLYVSIHVKQHNIFKREGDDIYTEIPISFAQAALGDEIEVPTLEGKANMKIPAGTQTNTIFRMKGRGIPNIRGHGKGDEKIRAIVDVPTRLTKKQKELLEEFDRDLGKKKGIIDKIKDSF
ncbi:molecular chaperone DnaJ [Candidatus Woesearchaeota archaeon CG10_big_fil_rev_8_21_14_0_10_44_13]|nr:MAG: molecular chaperone DnaJ [Candidatus Woesearchaeota archaeon CG10_big_fil_rev_8_21_14_0_10_44_13]